MNQSTPRDENIFDDSDKTDGFTGRVSLLQRKAHEGQYSLERVYREVSKALQSIGIDATIATAPVHSMGLADRLRIVRWAKRSQGDVIHITGDITFAALATKRNRTVITIHDCEVLDRNLGLRRALLRAFWYDLPSRRASAVIVISKSTKQKLLDYLPHLDPKKVHVVPSATCEALSFSPKGSFASPPRVLQIGTKANKNLLRLIEALEGIACTLVIVGRLSRDQKSALTNADITFENLVGISDTALAAEYDRADIVTFVSLQEGFGMPIIEAQRVGRPVLTSNCSSMPEVAGNGALLVDPTDVASIAAGLRALIEDPSLRAQIVEAGRRNAQRFSIDAIARAHAQIYAQVLECSQ